MTPVTDHRPAATTASARPGTRRPGRRLLARLRANASINAGLLVGLAAFFGLIGAVPVYVHLASSAVFAEIEREAVEADRAPFSYFFDVDADGPLRWADYEATTEVLLGDLDLDLGVDVADRDVRLSSRRFDLVADGGSPSDGSDATAATSLALSSSRRFAELVDLIAGDPLPTSATAPGRPIPVLVSARLVDELGLVVGQRRTLVDTAVAADAAIRRTPIEVVGVWEANDEFDPRWIVRPQFFADDLIVGEADLLALTEGDRPPAIDQIQWYLLASTAGVGPDRIADIVDRQGEIAELAAELGPGVGLRRGPDLVLDEFLRRADALQSTLTSYAAPATVVVALFVLMVVARNAETRRGELAVLRSRGVPLRRTFAGLTIETAAVIAVALALAPAVAFAVASLMIRTRAFLDIDPGRPTPGFWQFGALPLVVLGLAAIAVLVAHLLALVGPARTTIVDRRSAAGRGRLTAVTTGLRSRVDLFVIVAVVVAVWRRDRPRPLTATGVIDDPGIVVVPAALGLVAGLTLHRILPVLMRLVAGLLERTRSTALYLAAKRSSRATASFRWPLLLVVVATSLAAFLASLSLSLERQLVDDTYLTVGADHAAEQFVRPGATLATAADYEALPGVAAATTTLELDGQLDGAGGEPVRVLAVDVATYGTAVHWQSWYDDETLGDLLTVLQGAPDHVIVSESLIERSGLRVGDDLTYAVGVGFTPDFRTRLLTTTGSVVATTRHFPRWAGAERAPLLVANVEYLAAQADVEATTTLLRSVEPGAVVEPPFRARDTSAGGQLAAVRDQPERQGVFGILTASFLASTALAGLALVLHSVFSYRERSVEVGILRAGGLGSGELGRLVGFDAVVTGAVGVGVGAATGIAASRWLVTDVVATIESTAPAEARIAWGPTLSVAGAFVLTLVVIAVVTTPLLTRLRVFQAIKLGEQL